jgi:hypothetical protein
VFYTVEYTDIVGVVVWYFRAILRAGGACYLNKREVNTLFKCISNRGFLRFSNPPPQSYTFAASCAIAFDFFVLVVGVAA